MVLSAKELSYLNSYIATYVGPFEVLFVLLLVGPFWGFCVCHGCITVMFAQGIGSVIG